MKTARYSNKEQTKILLTYNGKTIEVPVNPNNAVYKKIIADGITIEPFTE